jgi:putative transposase
VNVQHLLAAARYVKCNPVRAKLCQRPEDWPWLSVGAHLAGQDDSLLTVHRLLELVPHWAAFVGEPDAPEFQALVHAHGSTGRPLSPDAFVL